MFFRGGFSTVFAGSSLSTGDIVAIKNIRYSSFSLVVVTRLMNFSKTGLSEQGEHFIEENVRNEIAVLQTLKNIPKSTFIVSLDSFHYPISLFYFVLTLLVVQMIECIEDEDDIFIVFELLLGCELFDIVCEKVIIFSISITNHLIIRDS